MDEFLRGYGWTITDSGCWEFDGPRNQDGYGRVRYLGRKTMVHRLAHEAWVGPIPDGLFIRHKCDNPPCVNPEHLETGTNAQNVQDKMDRGRFTPKVGSVHGMSKLTESDVLAIRAEYAAGGITHKQLGIRYGVCEASVQHITKRRTWRHI